MQAPKHSTQKVLRVVKRSKITLGFSFREVWFLKNGINSYWRKCHNLSRYSFAIICSTTFQKMNTSTLHLMIHRFRHEWMEVIKKWIIKNILRGVWRSFGLRNQRSGLWSFLNLFFEFWTWSNEASIKITWSEFLYYIGYICSLAHL